MTLEILVVIDLNRLRLLEKPAEVVPEIGSVSYRRCNHVSHLVECDEDHDILFHQGFVAVLALSEAEIDLLALVDAVAGVLGIGG